MYIRLALGILLFLSLLSSEVFSGQVADPIFLQSKPQSYTVSHTAFNLSYNQQFKQPDWVQYDLTCDDLSNPVPRTEDFREDLSVPGGTLDQFDYKKSGFDRGHIAPARDMARSTTTMSESFLMSNMAPQQSFFNRFGLWRKTEDVVRVWACDHTRLTVVGGPILNGEVKQVGKLFVAKYFYKIILADNAKAIAFIFENGGDKTSIKNFVVSVDQVEEMTGIDFFSDLPEQWESEIESHSDASLWAFRQF